MLSCLRIQWRGLRTWTNLADFSILPALAFSLDM
jgi:hypothetical protein